VTGRGSSLRLGCLFLGAAACGSRPPPPSAHAHPDAPAHHDHVHHRFEDAETWARRFDDPGRDAWQRPAHVVELLALREGMTVVDLGAGTGYFLPHLARAVGPSGRVLALDVEPDMVRYMTERAAREGLANVEARRVPPEDPELPAGTADRVLIVDTWHHIGERVEYTRKLASGLAPGGAVYIIDFTLETDKGPPRPMRLAPERVAEELRAGGLDAQIVPEDLPDQYVVVGRAAAR
jgi:cyclopropane fatty-acyl-phospholipid synthase-like methyltransferase